MEQNFDFHNDCLRNSESAKGINEENNTNNIMTYINNFQELQFISKKALSDNMKFNDQWMARILSTSEAVYFLSIDAAYNWNMSLLNMIKDSFQKKLNCFMNLTVSFLKQYNPKALQGLEKTFNATRSPAANLYVDMEINSCKNFCQIRNYLIAKLLYLKKQLNILPSEQTYIFNIFNEHIPIFKTKSFIHLARAIFIWNESNDIETKNKFFYFILKNLELFNDLEIVFSNLSIIAKKIIKYKNIEENLVTLAVECFKVKRFDMTFKILVKHPENNKFFEEILRFELFEELTSFIIYAPPCVLKDNGIIKLIEHYISQKKDLKAYEMISNFPKNNNSLIKYDGKNYAHFCSIRILMAMAKEKDQDLERRLMCLNQILSRHPPLINDYTINLIKEMYVPFAKSPDFLSIYNNIQTICTVHNVAMPDLQKLLNVILYELTCIQCEYYLENSLLSSSEISDFYKVFKNIVGEVNFKNFLIASLTKKFVELIEPSHPKDNMQNNLKTPIYNFFEYWKANSTHYIEEHQFLVCNFAISFYILNDMERFNDIIAKLIKNDQISDLLMIIERLTQVKGNIRLTELIDLIIRINFDVTIKNQLLMNLLDKTESNSDRQQKILLGIEQSLKSFHGSNF